MTTPSRGIKAAVRTRRTAVRALHWLDLGLDAATLALFPDDWLDALTASYYDGSPTYSGAEHNRQGFFDWELDAVERFFPARGTVLVTSAGGGREALALLEAGHRVVATECVATLFRVLEANLAPAAASGAARALHTAPDDVPTARGPFDAALLGWTAYTHLIGAARRISFLRRLRPALRPGAPVLVSYWGRLDALDRGPHTTAMIANLIRRPLGRRLVEVGETTRNGHLQRTCALGEVPAEARAAGFEVEEENREGCSHTVLRAPAAA